MTDIDLSMGDTLVTRKGEFVVTHVGDLTVDFANGEYATKEEIRERIEAGDAEVRTGRVAL